MTEKANDIKKSYESFWFLFLAGIYGLIALVLFLCFQPAGVITKNDDFNFYVLGWAFFVPLGLEMSALAEKIRYEFFTRFHSFGFVSAFFNFVFLLYELCPTTWVAHTGWIQLAEFILLQCGIGLIAKGFQLTGQRLSGFLEKSLTVFMGFVFVLWISFLSPETVIFLKNASIFNWLLGCLFVWLLYRALSNKPEGLAGDLSRSDRATSFKSELFYYLVALFLIVFLAVDLNFGVNRYHYTFFLGPLADFREGKSFLVNINSQYGILIFYFLSLFFKILPLGFKSFCFVLTFLYIAQYFCFYFITRQLFKSRLFSFFCLAVFLILNYFAAMSSITEFPSVGPLRFGFVYALLFLIILRNQYPAYKKYFFILESAVVASAVFWSFEVCVYTVPAYLGLILYESINRGAGYYLNWNSLVRRLFCLTGFSSFILIFIYGDVYRRTGDWPHWSYYFDYIFLYKNGFGMFLVPALGGWWIIAAILLISTIVIWGSLTKWKDEDLPTHFNAVVLLTFYGIFQFLYYWGRAHENNLFMVNMPSVLLSAYWLYENRVLGMESFVPPVFRKTLFVLSAIGLGIYLQFFIHVFAVKLSQNLVQMPLFPRLVLSAAKDLPRDDDFTKRADKLMKKYSGSKTQLIYLFGDRGLEVSMYTGRVNLFPYNDIGQVCICPPVFQRVVAYNPKISIGDYIYISEDIDFAHYGSGDDKSVPAPLEKMILYKLTHEYVMKLIEQQRGIIVFQVMGQRPVHS